MWQRAQQPSRPTPLQHAHASSPPSRRQLRTGRVVLLRAHELGRPGSAAAQAAAAPGQRRYGGHCAAHPPGWYRKCVSATRGRPYSTQLPREVLTGPGMPEAAPDVFCACAAESHARALHKAHLHTIQEVARAGVSGLCMGASPHPRPLSPIRECLAWAGIEARFVTHACMHACCIPFTRTKGNNPVTPPALAAHRSPLHHSRSNPQGEMWSRLRS